MVFLWYFYGIMSKMLCMNQSHTKIYVHGNAMGLTHYKNSRCVIYSYRSCF